MSNVSRTLSNILPFFANSSVEPLRYSTSSRKFPAERRTKQKLQYIMFHSYGSHKGLHFEVSFHFRTMKFYLMQLGHRHYSRNVLEPMP